MWGNICYCVHQAEDYGENHVILAVFKSKKKAEKYMQVEKFLNPYDSIWVSEEKFKDDDFDINTRVTNYYNYQIESDMQCSLSDLDEFNEAWDNAEPAYWYADNYVEISSDGSYIVGYSNESYSKAREIALDYWGNVKSGGKKKCQYEILDRQDKNENRKH